MLQVNRGYGKMWQTVKEVPTPYDPVCGEPYGWVADKWCEECYGAGPSCDTEVELPEATGGRGAVMSADTSSPSPMPSTATLMPAAWHRHGDDLDGMRGIGGGAPGGRGDGIETVGQGGGAGSQDFPAPRSCRTPPCRSFPSPGDLDGTSHALPMRHRCPAPPDAGHGDDLKGTAAIMVAGGLGAG